MAKSEKKGKTGRFEAAIKALPANFLGYIRNPQVWGFFVSLVVIGILSVAFFHPDAAAGNELRQHDMQQGAANGQEVKAYMESHPGEEPRWTNSLFSGMPTFQISPSYPSDSLFSWITTLYGAGLPAPSNLLFMMMTGMLIMLMAMKVRWYYALIGAVAWGFSSYFVIIIGAGHIWKFVTLAYIPPTIGGIIMAYRGRLLAGTALAALFAMMQIQSNHPQMTYYFLFVVLGIVICYAIDACRKKKYARFLKATGALLIAGALAVCANLPSLYNTWKYSKETMRGAHTELTSDRDNTEATAGLDRDYITQYSYGRAESFSLLIPNIKGGASARPEGGRMVASSILEVDGAAEEAALRLNEAEMQYVGNYVGQYFGEPEGTNGPVYIGAVIFVLFLLGCFIVRGPLKWVLLALTLLSVFLALGRNMQWFTDLFIDYVPLYSKFRTVESILVIAEFTMPVLAILTLQKLFTTPNAFKRYRTWIYLSFGLTAFICFVGWIWPSAFGPAISESDVQISNMIGAQLAQMGYSRAETAMFAIDNPQIAALVSDIRYGMVSADSLRSLLFVLLTLGAAWLTTNKVLKPWMGAALVGLLVVTDLYSVDKRYLNHSSFCSPELSASDPFPLTENDRMILADTAMNYRVLDIPRFSSPDPSYHHKMIGGYHAAKLTRYQDLIDRHLGHFPAGNVSAADFAVINMLNAKYIISPDGQLMTNPDALCNAWFVDRIDYVDTPDAEMNALQQLDPAVTAVADKRFTATLGTEFSAPAPGDTIFETSYAPDRLTYAVSSARGGVAVFSEVYFPWGWEATIDGKPAEIGRVNYILRALKIPAGAHTVEMRFAPASVRNTVGVARVAVITIYLLLFAALCVTLLRPNPKK